MKSAEYFETLRKAWEDGRISNEAYDAGVENEEFFVDDREEEDV